MIKKTLTNSIYIVYCVSFYILWTAREILLRPILENAFGDRANALIGTAIKLLIWTVPAIILIKCYEDDMYISLKQMVSAKVKWPKYLLILAGFFIYHLIIAAFSFGKIRLHSGFERSSLIGTVLFVGITEETVFRGWLLNATLKKMKPWPAVLLNASLFLVIHFPIWIYKGLFADPATIPMNCVGVFLLGIVFGRTFIKSKNILTPIMLHMGWNLFNILLFGS